MLLLIVNKGHGNCFCSDYNCHFVLFLNYVSSRSQPYFKISFSGISCSLIFLSDGIYANVLLNDYDFISSSVLLSVLRN